MISSGLPKRDFPLRFAEDFRTCSSTELFLIRLTRHIRDV